MGKRVMDMKKAEEVHNIFSVFDRDRDGAVNATEFMYALKKLDHPTNATEADRMIKEADLNKDGKERK